MFNRTTSTKFFAPRRFRMEIRIPKLEIRNKLRFNSEILISKFETIPKFKLPNLKIFNSIVLKIRNYVIWICFQFRISCFEFFVPLSWRPLPRGVRPWGSYSACVEINTPRGESSFIRFPKPKFNGKFQICLIRAYSLKF